MSASANRTILTGIAGEVITKYHVAALDSGSDNVLVLATTPASTTEIYFGVVQETTVVGHPAAVVTDGQTFAISGVLPAGTSDLMTDGTGRVIPYVATALAAAENQKIGRWLPNPNEVAAAAGDVVRISVNINTLAFSA